MTINISTPGVVLLFGAFLLLLLVITVFIEHIHKKKHERMEEREQARYSQKVVEDNDYWKRILINRGFAIYHPTNGEWTWKDEVDDED